MDEVGTEVVVRFTGGPHDGSYFSLPLPLVPSVAPEFLATTRLPIDVESVNASWGVYAYDSEHDVYVLVNDEDASVSPTPQLNLIIDGAQFYASLESRLGGIEARADEAIGAKLLNFLFAGISLGVLLGYVFWG